VVNSVFWPHMLFGPCQCVYGATVRNQQDKKSTLPNDDDDYTETCWSCFNINFNVDFKIVFKTVQLCISWWIKNLLYYQDAARFVCENEMKWC
jgi:hypothetical protein